MASIPSEVVTVNIDVQDASVAQAAFNKFLYASYHTVGTELIRDYTDITDIETDFASWPSVLAAASAFFAQSVRPETFSIGRLTTASTKKFRLTPTAANSTTYGVEINGTEVTYTSDSSATVAEITAGLTTAINALSVAVTATDNSTSVDVVADAAGFWFTCVVSQGVQKLTCQETTTGGASTIAAELSAISVERDDWYGLAVADHDETTIANVSAWVLTKVKMFGASTSDPNALTTSTTDVLSDLETEGSHRTYAIWHQDPGSFPEIAWAAGQFPYTPGSRTWAYKRLTGIAASDSYLTGTNITNLAGKNANIVGSVRGVVVATPGKMASGRFIDITHGIDWMMARCQERVLDRLINLPKIPYTDAGLAVIEGEVRAQVQEGIREGVIADDDNISFTTLAVAQQASADRTARIARGINFKARLAGAVHQVIINGTVFP